MQITIDGPAGSGKSTVAKLLAQELDMLYLDTGAMYRAITDYVIKNDINLKENPEKLRDIIDTLEISFNKNRVFLNGEEVTDDIRSREVTNKVSEVSAIDFVRESLTKKQRNIAAKTSVVMDGRDTGSAVLPNANIKFYLDASPECRARRRGLETGINESTPEFEQLKNEIIRRDYLDSHRKLNPLVIPENAIYINTDDLNISEVLNTLLEKVQWSM